MADCDAVAIGAGNAAMAAAISAHEQGAGRGVILEKAPRELRGGWHSTPIDAEAPPHGDRTLTDKTNRLFGRIAGASAAGE